MRVSLLLGLALLVACAPGITPSALHPAPPAVDDESAYVTVRVSEELYGPRAHVDGPADTVRAALGADRATIVLRLHSLVPSGPGAPEHWLEIVLPESASARYVSARVAGGAARALMTGRAPDACPPWGLCPAGAWLAVPLTEAEMRAPALDAALVVALATAAGRVDTLALRDRRVREHVDAVSWWCAPCAVR